MKKISLLLVFLLSFMSCSDEKDLSGFGTLQIVIKATYGGIPLFLGNSYDYFGNGSIKFTKAEFFLSDLTAIGESRSVIFKDVDYVSILAHNLTLQDAIDGLTLSYLVPGGNYKGISFNIGVNPAQNKTKPVDYSPSSPLGEGTHYWAGWNSYIFSKTEGILNNGNSLSFSYHAGFDIALRNISGVKDFYIENSETATLYMDIDFKKIFEINGTGMDIASNPQIHNSSDIMTAFVDRYKAAIQIR